MTDERFLNSYHNVSTPPGPDVPAELAAFMLAVDPILTQAAELARLSGLAIALVSHDEALLAAVADRIVRIRDGRTAP